MTCFSVNVIVLCLSDPLFPKFQMQISITSKILGSLQSINYPRSANLSLQRKRKRKFQPKAKGCIKRRKLLFKSKLWPHVTSFSWFAHPGHKLLFCHLGKHGSTTWARSPSLWQAVSYSISLTRVTFAKCTSSSVTSTTCTVAKPQVAQDLPCKQELEGELWLPARSCSV